MLAAISCCTKPCYDATRLYYSCAIIYLQNSQQKSRQVRYRIMYGLPWIPIFVTSRAIRQLFSRVTSSLVKIIAESPHSWQKISIHGNSYIILYFTRHFMFWLSTQTLKNNYRLSQFNLWGHVKASYRYREVIFVDCSCTRKLVQRRSSLVNNNPGYWF